MGGSQSTYSNVVGTGERAVVNGHHDPAVFQTMLDKFIDAYVLCKNCHLPEIDIIVKKGWISAKCAACGWAGDLDNGHKLAKFITTYPPDKSGLNIGGSGGDEGGGSKKSKEERRAAKAEKQRQKDQEGGDEDDDDHESDDEQEKEKKEKKDKKDKKDKKEKKEKKSKDVDDEGEEGEKKEKKEKK